MHKCEVCGSEHETKRGLSIHKTRLHDPEWRKEETLRELYHEKGLSCGKIADKFDVDRVSIYHRMVDLGIERRGRLHYQQNRAAIVSTDKRGYVYSAGAEGRKIRIHKLLAIAMGADPYELFSGDYHIHHKNNISWDNRPENIEVLTHSEHMELTQSVRHGNSEYESV